MMDNFEELNIFSKVEIVEQKQKFGVYLDETGEYLLPCIYDNIFCICSDYYVVIKNNKYGLFRITAEKSTLVADSIYEFINMSSSDFILLSTRFDALYVNLHTGKIISADYIKSSEDYLYACEYNDDTFYTNEYIINKYSGDIIHLGENYYEDEPF